MSSKIKKINILSTPKVFIALLLFLSLSALFFYTLESMDSRQLKSSLIKQLSKGDSQIDVSWNGNWDYVCSLAQDTISKRAILELSEFVDVTNPGKIPDTFSANHNFHLVFLKNRHVIEYVSVKSPELDVQSIKYRLYAPEMAKCVSRKKAVWTTKINKAVPNVKLLFLGEK